MTAFELHVETLKAMARFYSWTSVIMKFLWFMTDFKLYIESLKALTKIHLWKPNIRKFFQLNKLNFYYGVIRLYGRNSVKKSLSNKKRYLDHLGELILAKFDKKTEKLRQYFSQKKNKCMGVIAITDNRDKKRLMFFDSFLTKIGISTAFVEKHENNKEPTVILMSRTSYLQDKHLDKNLKRIPIEAISLFKLCEEVCKLLNVKSKRLRKAFDSCIKEFGGEPNWEDIRIMIGD
jgi:hypothetical protein